MHGATLISHSFELCVRTVCKLASLGHLHGSDAEVHACTDYTAAADMRVDLQLVEPAIAKQLLHAVHLGNGILYSHLC